MRILEYKCKIGDKDVKSVLRNNYRLAASVVTALKNSNGIFVNGENVTVRKTLAEGDELKLVIPEYPTDNIVPVEGELDVVYEDEDILCVNKPSGMPTHPSQNHYYDTLANLVCWRYKDIPFTFRVSNRLDSYTSGLVLISRNMYSASVICTEDFRLHTQKTYHALCRGLFDVKSGSAELPIARCEGSTIKRMVSPNGKYALTDYRVISEECGNSLLELKPKTGRTHQIRVHMAHIGHPLVNDFLYDDEYDGVSRFYLSCRKISFIHPHTKQQINLSI